MARQDPLGARDSVTRRRNRMKSSPFVPSSKQNCASSLRRAVPKTRGCFLGASTCWVQSCSTSGPLPVGPFFRWHISCLLSLAAFCFFADISFFRAENGPTEETTKRGSLPQTTACNFLGILSLHLSFFPCFERRRKKHRLFFVLTFNTFFFR